MAEITAIAWTRSSFNPWIGCTEVSTEETGGGGCDHCYARELDAFHKWGGATHWGVGVPRHRTSAAYWRQPEKWDRQAAREREADVLWNGRLGFWPVFPSLCDPFDNEVPEEWHADFWRLIRATPNLTWLLLTKRIGNVEKMAPPGEHPNVWIGASIVNQREADRDVPKLNALRGFAKLFISYEPALGQVDWARTIPCGYYCDPHPDDPFYGHFDHGPNGVLGHINQIIVGGESNQGKHKARPFNVVWAYETISQCRLNGIAPFVKQLGSNVVESEPSAWPNGYPHGNKTVSLSGNGFGLYHVDGLRDRKGADPSEWPEDLRVQEFPA